MSSKVEGKTNANSLLYPVW